MMFVWKDENKLGKFTLGMYLFQSLICMELFS